MKLQTDFGTLEITSDTCCVTKEPYFLLEIHHDQVECHEIKMILGLRKDQAMKLAGFICGHDTGLVTNDCARCGYHFKDHRVKDNKCPAGRTGDKITFSKKYSFQRLI